VQQRLDVEISASSRVAERAASLALVLDAERDARVQLERALHAGLALALDAQRDARVQLERALHDEMAARLHVQSRTRLLEQRSDGDVDETFAALYQSFEDRFRGSREEIKQRLAIYPGLLEGAGAGTADRPVLDVGCGRGELVELLRERGMAVRGVDLDAQ